EVWQAVLPEMLVNEELRELNYQQVLVPTFTVSERSFHAQRGAGQVGSIDVPLTVRAIAGLLLGLLTIQLLGDEVIAQRWEELPEVLASLLFDPPRRCAALRSACEAGTACRQYFPNGSDYINGTNYTRGR